MVCPQWPHGSVAPIDSGRSAIGVLHAEQERAHREQREAAERSQREQAAREQSAKDAKTRTRWRVAMALWALLFVAVAADLALALKG